MQQPKRRAWNGIVVARVSQIQEAQDVFVNEIEPEKTVVLAGAAVHREIEVWRHTKSGQNVPRRGNRQNDERRGENMQPFPNFSRQELPRDAQIDDYAAPRRAHGVQSFALQADAEAGGEQQSPELRPG